MEEKLQSRAPKYRPFIGKLESKLAKSSKPSKAKKSKITADRKKSAANKKRASIGERFSSAWDWLKNKFRKIIKWALIACLGIIAAIMLLTVLYRFESVKPISTLMLGRYVTLQPVDRQWIELEDIAPTLYQSVMMSEDGQFCQHNGVDWGAVNLVITDALEGERPRGASTITMQTGKNLFLWGGRSYLRKALEVPLALWIDLVLPKKRIMEIYLNIAEWDDDGVFGINAGSKSQFGRSAAKLTRRQSALMAVTLPNPILREPSKPNAGMNRLARTIERRARQSGAYIKCLK